GIPARLKNRQNAVVATDTTRASRDCCSEVNAAAAWARNASKSIPRPPAAPRPAPAGAQRRTDKRSQQHHTIRRTGIGKPPGLPLPRRNLISNFI
ncbi:MAG: hypothetical protein WCB55_04390, partial [Pseudolabrys sp.]